MCKKFLFLLFYLFIAKHGVAQNQTKAPHDSSYVKNLTRKYPVDSLENELNKTASISLKVETLVRLSFSSPPPDNKRGFALKAFELAKENKDDFGAAISLMALLPASTDVNEIDSCTKRAISYFQKHGEVHLLWSTKYNSSNSLFRTGHYIESFKILNEFLTEHPAGFPHNYYTAAWNRMGEIYRLLKDYNNALYCYRKSIHYANNDQLRFAATSNIGSVYKSMGLYDSAFFYYEKASLLSKKTTAFILFCKANLYFELKDYATAVVLASKSLHLYDSSNNQEGIALAAGSLTQIYFALGQYDDCIRYGERALRVSKSINYFLEYEDINNVCSNVADAYEKKGQFEKANYYNKYHTRIKETLFSSANHLGMLNEQIKLVNKNQEQEKSLLIGKQRLAQETVSFQRTIIIISTIALLFTSVIATKLFRRNKAIAKLNLELKEKVEEVEAQTEELRAQEEELRQSMEELSATQEKVQELLTEVQSKEREVSELLSVSDDSVVVFDRKFKVTNFNSVFKNRYFNITKGDSVLNIFPEKRHSEKTELYNKILAGETVTLMDTGIANGKTTHVRVKQAPYRNEEGTVIGVVSFATDITDLIVAKETVERFAEDLKSANEEISAINSNLEKIVEERTQKITDQRNTLLGYAYFNAHKVRGPLARILGLIHIMGTDIVADEQTIQYISMLKKAGDELDEQIKEINGLLSKDSD